MAVLDHLLEIFQTTRRFLLINCTWRLVELDKYRTIDDQNYTIMQLYKKLGEL